MMWIRLSVCMLVVSCVLGTPEGDLVVSLPGLPIQPPWKHYSGYLNASGTKHLHYWFIESANNPSSDPVVLWLNGGPGCSSDLGLLTEHGPFRISENGSGVSLNKYSWNNVANVLYLEAPSGVGYSFSDDKNYTTDDDQVAFDNYLALKDFFSKFPEFSSNKLFITGESYGGIYVPTLSNRVIHDNTMNFQGMAIGNGISNFDTNDNSLLYFGYYHGLIGDSLWGAMLNACCPGECAKSCHFVNRYLNDDTCSDLVGQGLQIIYNIGLNEYNLYAPCEVPKPEKDFIYNHHSFTYNLPSLGHRQHPFMIQKLNQVNTKKLGKERLRVTPPCLDYGYVINYMNTEAVRQALHISALAQDWDVCSAAVGGQYKTIYRDVTQFYQAVIAAGKKILVYNGDVDMACNFLGDEWFVEALNLPVVQSRVAWYIKDSTDTKQVAGFVKRFKQLTLLTVRGAGHMVPQDQPIAALEMFSDFVQSL